ncbi:hypothetical protein AB0940_29070 [Streptomyces sp. NPDC006656]
MKAPPSLEAVRDASLRQAAATQSRRRTLLKKPVSDLERWATGTTD